MKVLQPIATTQSLVIRARENASLVDVTIYDFQGNETQSLNASATYNSDGYLTISLSHAFAEGERYKCEILKSSDQSLIWRGMLFITSQTTQDYQITT